MARGPLITEEEKKIAKQLKADGLNNKEIAQRLERSVATVYKMLKPQRSTPYDAAGGGV